MASVETPTVRPEAATEDGAPPTRRLAFPLRVAVTGHRWFPDDDDRLFESVGAALLAAKDLIRAPRGPIDRLRDRLRGDPSTGIRVILSSALAEGADRLVARATLADDGVLEAVDPMPRDRYVRTFSGGSRSEDEYERLHHLARRVVHLSGDPDDPKAFAAAGRALVERSDVLLAVWDRRAGDEGGTADVVVDAIERGHPIVVVDPEGVEPPVVDDGTGDLPPAFAALGLSRRSKAKGRFLKTVRAQYRALEEFNRSSPAQSKVQRIIDQQADRLPPSSDIPGLPISAVRAWLLPPFVRADVVARRFAAWNSSFIWSMYALGAGAVAAVAAAIALERRGFAWVEVAFLGALILVYAAGRGEHVHQRWIGSRSLAERLRSAFFVCVAGLGRREGASGDQQGQQQMEDWADRAFWIVWIDRPDLRPTEADAAPLRRLVADSWIAGQITYHESRRRHHERLEKVQTFLLGALVLVGLVVAWFHTREHAGGAQQWLDFLAPTLPAIAGAVAAVGAHRQHRRHAEAFRRVATRLTAIRGRLQDAAATRLLPQVQRAVADAAETVAHETQSWVGVMQFQDVELEG